MALKAADTGPGPMIMVALEQHFPESVRIIHDDLALRILPSQKFQGYRIDGQLKVRDVFLSSKLMTSSAAEIAESRR